MAVLILLIYLMISQGELSQGKETLTEIVSRIEPELRARAVDVRRLLVPLSDSQFQELAEGVTRHLVPVHAESEECRAHSNILVDAVLRGETWALSMLDASSKLPSGLLGGQLMDLGHYQQCVSIQAPSQLFMGQHCFVETRGILPPELHYYLNCDITNTPKEVVEVLLLPVDLGFSVCVPSSCTAQDVKVHMDHVLAQINASSVLYESSCSTAQPLPFRAKDWLACAVFSSIAILVCWATYVESQCSGQSELVSAFSLRRSWNELVDTRSTEEVSCVAGVRVLATSIVVIVHCFAKQLWDPSLSPLTAVEILDSFGTSCIEVASRVVDVFFLIGGMTRAFSFLRERSQGKPLNTLHSILRRYFRYTPSLAMTMLFSATLLIRCGSGPFWKKLMSFSVWGCCNLWPTGILHISNFFYPQAACVQHSWYLACDFQLFLISPLFLLPLHYNRTLGLLLLAVTGGSCLIAYSLTSFRDSVDCGFLTFLYKNRKNHEMIFDIYYATQFRAPTYFLGMALGCFLFSAGQQERPFRLTKVKILLGWIISLAAVVGHIVISNIVLGEGYQRTPWLDTTYNVLTKQVMAAVVGWIIAVSYLGHGGVLSDFLSWSGFRLLSKLTLGVYLVHLDLIRIISNSHTSSEQYDSVYTLHVGLGALFMSVLVALVLYLCVESPSHRLVTRYLQSIGGRPTANNSKNYQLVPGSLPYTGEISTPTNRGRKKKK